MMRRLFVHHHVDQDGGVAGPKATGAAWIRTIAASRLAPSVGSLSPSITSPQQPTNPDAILIFPQVMETIWVNNPGMASMQRNTDIARAGKAGIVPTVSAEVRRPKRRGGALPAAGGRSVASSMRSLGFLVSGPPRGDRALFLVLLFRLHIRRPTLSPVRVGA